MPENAQMFRSLLSDEETQKLREIAERKGMSTRGVRDFALRDFIRKEEREFRLQQEEH